MSLVSIARFQIESAARRLEVKPGLFMDHKDFSSGYQESTQGQWTLSSDLVFWIWTFHMRIVFRQDVTRPIDFRLDSAPSVPLSGVRHQGSIWLNGLQSNLIASSCSRTGLQFMDTNYAFHWTLSAGPQWLPRISLFCSIDTFQHRQYMMLYQLVFLRILRLMDWT